LWKIWDRDMRGIFVKSLPTILRQFRGLLLGHVIVQNPSRRSGDERPLEREEERPPTPALEGGGVARHHPPTGRHPNDHARPRLPRPKRRSSKGEGARAATRWPAAAPTTSRGRGSPLAAAGAGRAARRHRPAPGHLQPRGMGRRGGAVAKPLRLFILLLPLPVLKSNRSDRIRLAPAPEHEHPR